MDKKNGRILTCVYCGIEYPQGTPAWDNKVLTDHIKVCEKHPMRAAEATIAKLKAALIGLVGAFKKEELEAMKLTFESLPASEADKHAIVNAINILIELDNEEEAVMWANAGIARHG